jgi:hypothetical protein
VVILFSILPRRGVSLALLKAVEEIASLAGVERLWLVTTNDNAGAMACYRAAGWSLSAVQTGAMREGRKIKPQNPLFNNEGIPIEDEVELRLEKSAHPNSRSYAMF